jgi:hypothetical protein
MRTLVNSLSPAAAAAARGPFKSAPSAHHNSASLQLDHPPRPPPTPPPKKTMSSGTFWSDACSYARGRALETLLAAAYVSVDGIHSRVPAHCRSHIVARCPARCAVGHDLQRHAAAHAADTARAARSSGATHVTGKRGHQDADNKRHQTSAAA